MGARGACGAWGLVVLVEEGQIQVSSGESGNFNVTGGSEGTDAARRTGCLMETTDELPVAVDAELVLGRSGSAIG